VITGSDGTGLPANFTGATARLTLGTSGFTDLTVSGGVVGEQWLQSPEITGTTETANATLQFTIGSSPDTAATDYAVAFSDFGVYEVTP
jgi:hypothetical protein